MKIVVVGQSGTIGSEVTRVLQNNGHEVIPVSRSTQPAIDIESLSSIESFFAGIDLVDAIIIAAGNAAGGALDKLSDEQVELGLHSKLAGQVNVVRKGLQKLRPGGVFVLTGGMLAFSASPQTSMYSLVNAGLDGFVRAAAKDLTEDKRIVIVHPPFVSETAKQLGMDPSPWPASAEAAKAYLEAVEKGKNGERIFVEGYGL